MSDPTADLGPTSADWLPFIATPYQDAVKRLLAENRSLRAELATERKRHREDVRVLKAQLREGLSPELLALRRQMQKWRTRATVAEGRLSETRGRSSA